MDVGQVSGVLRESLAAYHRAVLTALVGLVLGAAGLASVLLAGEGAEVLLMSSLFWLVGAGAAVFVSIDVGRRLGRSD